jgi:hypothetical protein
MMKLTTRQAFLTLLSLFALLLFLPGCGDGNSQPFAVTFSDGNPTNRGIVIVNGIEVAAGQLQVSLRETSSEEVRRDTIRALVRALELEGTVYFYDPPWGAPLYTLIVPENRDLAEVRSQLAADPRVDYADFNHIFRGG